MVNKGERKMKKIIGLLIIICTLFITSYAITIGEDGVVGCYKNIYYTEDGTVYITDNIGKDSYDSFLAKMGEDYQVKVIDIENNDFFYIVIEEEAFSSSAETLEEVIFSSSVRYIGYNVFGENHNVKVKYDEDENRWNNITKENDEDYFGEVDFYAAGYASVDYKTVNAFNDKIEGKVYFHYVEKDCVLEFNIYDYDEDGEKVLNKTFTKNVEKGSRYIDYEFDFESDGKDHYITITIYDNLTDKNQWGETAKQNFLADDRKCILKHFYVYSNESELYFDILFDYLDSDCCVEMKFYDFDEEDNKIYTKSEIKKISKGTERVVYDVPFDFDDKYHGVETFFWEDESFETEIGESVYETFHATQKVNGYYYDKIDEENMSLTGSEYGFEIIAVPVTLLNINVSEIGAEAYVDCDGIKTVFIPKNITKIGENAFLNCYGIENVYYLGTEEEWEAITIEDGNDYLRSANIVFEYSENLVDKNISAGGGMLGEDVYNIVEAGLSLEYCYDECIAEIEIYNISKNTSDIYYEEIKPNGRTSKYWQYEIDDLDSTYEVFISLYSKDKERIYLAEESGGSIFTPTMHMIWEEDGDYTYIVNSSGEAEIYRYNGYETDVIIPETLGGKPVTALLGWSFSESGIESITIGKNIKSIGFGALSYNTNLKEIVIDDENQYFTFEDGVLYNKDKTKLILYLMTNQAESFTVPDSVTVLGAHAFEAHRYLKEIKLHDNITTLERQAFAYSESLSGELKLPESLKEIGSEALSSRFSKIYIPKNVTVIARDAFSWTPDLTEITVSAENEKFSSLNGVLYNKDKTVLMQYPSGRVSELFEIPPTVKTMERTSLNVYTNGLERSVFKIVMPKSVKVIKGAALPNPDYLNISTPYFYLGSEADFEKMAIGSFSVNTLENNIIFGTIKTFSDDYFRYEVTPKNTIVTGCNSPLVGRIEIPEMIEGIPVDTIGARAFMGQREITELVLPKYFRTFDVDEAFIGLTGLESFSVMGDKYFETSNLDGALYSIGRKQLIKYPAKGRYGVNYTVDENAEAIAPCAFMENQSLENIEIGEKVKNIGMDAFLDAKYLKNITVSKNNSKFASEDGVLYTKDLSVLIAYPTGKEETFFVVPKGVKSIATRAFSRSRIESVNIPDGILNIDSGAFYGCQALMNVSIGRGLVKIKPDVFAHCRALSDISFTSSVTEIENAFLNAGTVITVRFFGTEEDWNNINIIGNTHFLDPIFMNELTGETQTTFKEEDGKYSFTVELNDVCPASMLVVALYKDGQMVDIEMLTVENEDCVNMMFEQKDFDYAKTMLFEGAVSLYPISGELTEFSEMQID